MHIISLCCDFVKCSRLIIKGTDVQFLLIQFIISKEEFRYAVALYSTKNSQFPSIICYHLPMNTAVSQKRNASFTIKKTLKLRRTPIRFKEKAEVLMQSRQLCEIDSSKCGTMAQFSYNLRSRFVLSGQTYFIY